MSAHHRSPPRGDGLIPKDAASTLFKTFVGIAIVGLALAGAAFAMDPKRFGYTWLVGLVFVWTICMGGLFFTIIHHLTRASWSVGPRRVMEWLSQGLIACAALFLPLLAVRQDLWKWLHPDAVHDHLIQEKAGYLNLTFFLVRTAFYFVVWIGLAAFFYKNSRAQDTSGDRTLSEKMQGRAAPATALFALTISFAGIDWMMSLDPHWYSTMFGVYVFAGALIGGHAVLAIAVRKINLEKWGGDLITIEHQHDVGKYLFAWVVFWAYIGFSQFMLIWYANIPEETIWYRHRWEGGWSTISLGLLFGHFIIPFLLLLSRMDLGGLLAPLGIVGAVIARKVGTDPVVPMRDPYVPEAMKAENLV